MTVDQDTCQCGTETSEKVERATGGCTCGCCGPTPSGEGAKSTAGAREGD